MKLDDYQMLELLKASDWLGAARLLLDKTGASAPLGMYDTRIQTFVTVGSAEMQIHNGGVEAFWREGIGFGTCLAAQPDAAFTQIFIWTWHK